jgi:hypothetical protein
MKYRDAVAFALGFTICCLTGCAADASDENYGALYKTHVEAAVQGQNVREDSTAQHCVNAGTLSSCFPTQREPQ